MFKGCLKFKECLKKVTRVFQGSFKSVKGSFREISSGFQENVKGVSSRFKGVLRVFERGLKYVSGKFIWCFKGVSRKFQKSF